MCCSEALLISGDDQISTGSDSSIIWEIEADPVADSPPGQVDRVGSTIVEFDIFGGAMIRGRIVHNLVNDDRALAGNWIVW